MEKNKVVLSKASRIYVLAVLCILHSSLDITLGVLSSAVTQIKVDLELDDVKFGQLGSSRGVGNLLGSVIFAFIMDSIERKYVIIFSVIINTLAHFGFFFMNNFYILLSLNFIIGFCNVIGYLYFSIWGNQFAIQKWKTAMMTAINLSGTFGMIWGYLVNVLIGEKEWRRGFIIEGGILFFIFIALLNVNPVYFSKDWFFFKHEKKSTGKEMVSIFIKDEEGFTSESDCQDLTDNDETEEHSSSYFKQVICNASYMCLTFFRSNQYFINTAVSFWFSDYMQNTLNVNDPAKIFISYTSIFVLSSIIGISIGGCITSCTGGYAGRRNLLTLFLIQLIATPLVAFIPMSKTYLSFTLSWNLFNAFVAATTSMSVGCSFTLLPKRLITISNSISGFITNITAFFPAPFVYAYIKSFYGASFAMTSTMYYSFLSIVLLFVAMIKRRNFSKK